MPERRGVKFLSRVPLSIDGTSQVQAGHSFRTRLSSMLMVAAAAAAALATGCPLTGGDCSPGATTRRTMTIEQVELRDNGSASLTTTTGRDFIVLADVVSRCGSGGLEPGRRVVLQSTSNGSCPPDEFIVSCGASSD